MRTRALVSCGIVLVVGLLIWDRFQMRSKIRALERGNQAIRDAQTELEGSRAWPQVVLAAPVAPITAPEAANAEAERPGSDKALAPPPVSPAERLAHLEAVFRQEVTDSSWSSDARQRLEQGLLRLAKQPKSLSVECRSTLCRGEMKGSTTAECGELAHGVVAQRPPYFWDGPCSVVNHEDPSGDGCTLTAIFGREGTELPHL